MSEYQTDENCLGYLQHADLILYSYQKTGESSSAAVRMGIAARRPVAVTPIDIFNDVKSAVYTLPGFTPGDIADGVRAIRIANKTGDVAINRREEQARLWLSAHRYANISRHLYQLVGKMQPVALNYSLPRSFAFEQTSSKLSLKASGPEMKIGVGHKVEDGVRTTKQSGHLLYGPYMSIGPGEYRATIRGKVCPGGIDVAVVEATIGNNALPLGKIIIGESDSLMVLAKLPFTVPNEGGIDFQIRIWVSEKTDLQISSIEVEAESRLLCVEETEVREVA